MGEINVFKILSLGAIGLGCVLAIYTFVLLKKEQAFKQPRQRILNAIYIYMIFSLTLTGIGFFREVRKDKSEAEINKLKQQNEGEISKLREQNNDRLQSIKNILDGQMHYKSLKVSRLDLLTKDSTRHPELLVEIVNDLKLIDSSINSYLKNAEK